MADYPLSHAFFVEAPPRLTDAASDPVVLRVQYGENQPDPTDPDVSKKIRALNIGVGDPEAELIAQLLADGTVRRSGTMALKTIIEGQPAYDVGDELMEKICRIFESDRTNGRPRNPEAEIVMDALTFKPWEESIFVNADGCDAFINPRGRLVPYVVTVDLLDDDVKQLAERHGLTHGVFTFERDEKGEIHHGSRGHITLGEVYSTGEFKGVLTVLG